MTQQRYEFFPPYELLCNCGCGGGQDEIDEDFMSALVEMRREAEFPFVLTSAYRCPDYNEEVSKTGRNGPHTIGAVDVAVSRFRAYRFLELAYRYDMTGIGMGLHKGFIHLDMLTPDKGFSMRPNMWTY